MKSWLKLGVNSSRLHLALAIAWLALTIPTLVWWKDSVLWVAIMSIYANFANHWGAFEAAKAKEAANGGEK